MLLTTTTTIQEPDMVSSYVKCLSALEHKHFTQEETCIEEEDSAQATSSGHLSNHHICLAGISGNPQKSGLCKLATLHSLLIGIYIAEGLLHLLRTLLGHKLGGEVHFEASTFFDASDF